MSGRLVDRIGKYRIIERVGRGGMGTVLKAHDPVLDRTVALKVISGDVELTDELRTRFFREAQACARLSHPNVITVYDLADADGHLFIVMEFLEGEELKQVIAQRRPMSLEHKLSIMIQVCDGLGYAHQRGVVHRDVKPSNIFVLATGAVKILDFGIARIMTSGAGLTRTGLIMGTLRYMAPEQARGRADYRADIFSVGTVFYELLSSRPAFEAEDPMEILEALRTYDPPLLSDVDPSIPVEIAQVIARALRKDPGERIQELGEMRRVFETTRRRLVDEAEQLRASLRPQLDRLRQLQSSVRERLGAPVEDHTLPVVGESTGLDALKQLEGRASDRIAQLQEVLGRADAVEADVRRALQLQRDRNFEAVVQALEPIVREMPEHLRANAALLDAREQLDQERRRREALIQALADARGALDRGAFGVCLEQLNALEQAGLPLEIVPQLEGLRREAEAARAAHEAEARRREEMRRARERAERVREDLIAARRRARDADAPQTASATWGAAETRAAEGHASFEADAFGGALQHFEAALELYRSAEGEAREIKRARLRAEAEAASGRASEVRRIAESVEAAEHATPKWHLAVAAEERGTAALHAEDYTAATRSLEEARQLYEAAVAESRAALQRRERERVDRERRAVEQCRGDAEAAEAPVNATTRWRTAEDKRSMGERAMAEESYRLAGEYYAAALVDYREAATESRAVVLSRRRRAADEARQRAATARQSAEEASASVYAAEAWSRAERGERQAMAALQRNDFVAAVDLFDGTERAFRSAVSVARAERVRQERERVERGRALMETARAAAQTSGSAQHAMTAWGAAEARRRQGDSALGQEAFPDASEHFDAAARLYQEAEAAARNVARALERARAEADAAAARSASAREHAAARSASQYAVVLWAEARDAESGGTGALQEGGTTAAVELFDKAASLFQRAAEVADRAREEEARRVDALVGEARELLSGGHAGDALARAQEALTLMPAHRAAAEIRTRAEAQIQRKKAKRAAIDRIFADAQARLAAGDLDAAIGLLQKVLEQDPVHLGAIQVLDEARTRLEHERTTPSRPPEASTSDATIVAASDVEATAVQPLPVVTGTRALPDFPNEATLPTTVDDRGVVSAPGRRRSHDDRGSRRPSLRVLPVRIRWWALAGAAATVAAALMYLASGVVPRDSARDVEAQKRSAVSSRQAAETAGAPGLSPAEFAAAAQLEQQGDAAVAAKRFADARRLYARAASAYVAVSAEARAKGVAAALQAATRQLEAQVGAAKRAADLAGAREFARGQWDKAEATERQAAVSLKDQNHEAAQTSLREAEKLYRESEKTGGEGLAVRRSAEERDRAEALRRALKSAEDARASAEKAKQAAERVSAERYAGATFRSASQRERQARASLDGREYETAQAHFREAERGFAAAVQEANRALESERQRLAARQREQSDASAVRQRVVEARRSAEQAEADRWAANRMAAGRARERDGQVALEREDFARAKQAFQGAESDFHAALQESSRAADTAAKQAVSHARQTALEQRQVAEKAGADLLAKEIFDGASTRAKQAEALAQARRLSDAAEAYRDAAGRFTAAERRVRDIADVRTHADAAKKNREQAMRAGAERLAKDLFDSAAARHTEADRVANGPNILSAIPIYSEAAEGYRAAERRANALARPSRPDAPAQRPR